MSHAKFEGDRSVGGAWCHEVLEMLEAYVEGTLSDEQLRALQAHVGECHTCASFGESYGKVVQAVRSGLQQESDTAVFERLSKRLAEVS